MERMKGINTLYSDSNSKKKEVFLRLEQLRKKGTVEDYDKELASYRDNKYLKF